MKRHPVNVGQLVMGLVFLGIVVAWALVQSDVVTGRDLRWLLPLPWVVGGAIGLAAASVASVRRHRHD
jgi:4-hydroxybenzoate polyprenyltransferase